MSIITITSDWKNHDYYLACFKGTILKQCTDARIVDISHRITPFHSLEAAFIVSSSYRHFPEGAIHVIAVNSTHSIDCKYVALYINKHYFIGADNGIFGLMFPDEEKNFRIVNLQNFRNHDNTTFPELAFAHAAGCIADGKKIDTIGEPLQQYERNIPIHPTFDESFIYGSVIYIDSYNNVITNINRELFEKIGKNRPFHIYIKSLANCITTINQNYYEKASGELFALFNSLGLLEIGMRHGNAAQLLSLSQDTNIRIEFK